MRVALDLTPLRSGDTGVARYARAVHDALGVVRPDVELASFTIGRGRPVEVPVRRRVPVPLRAVHRAWALTGRPRVEALVGRVDVLHTLDMVPAPSAAPLVLTVHDLLALRMPDRFPERTVRIARAQAEAARRRAAVVLAVCDASAAEIAEVAGVPSERIAVARPGHRPVPAEAPAAVLSGPYLLYVGTVTARKGLTWLAQALADLPPGAPPVVVAGGDGFDGEAVRRSVAAVAGDRVRFLGRVDEPTLESLYAHATALCHPSEAEGYGIPVLEAMAFGVPVVACDIPSVREIGGDAVVLVPPRDPAALRDALGALLADEADRRRLAAAGRARAANRTWEACAASIGAVYDSVA